MRIIGLDLGSKTIGIAISDISQVVATPVETIYYRQNHLDIALEKLLSFIKDKEIKTIVLGLPKNMDGSVGSQGEYSLQFKQLLEANTSYEIVLVDERLTSSMVSRVMLEADASRQKRKDNVDKLAATVILQSYLDRKK